MPPTERASHRRRSSDERFDAFRLRRDDQARPFSRLRENGYRDVAMRKQPMTLVQPRTAAAVPVSRRVIDAAKLSLTFTTADGPVQALADIDLAIAEGEFV